MTKWTLNNTPSIVAMLCTFALIASSISCSKQEAPATPPNDTQTTSITVDLSQAELQFWQAAQSSTAHAHSAAITLEKSITQLLNKPQQAQLQHTQQVLHETQIALTQLFALVQLQQASPESLSETHRLLYRIQANPIQPGFLDRYGPYPYSGLVFDIGFPLTAASLLQQHGLTDSEEVVLGIYAISFMLEGDNNSRSAHDYVAADALSDEHLQQKLSGIHEIPNNRRRTLIQLQAQQLTKDLASLRQQLTDTSTGDLAHWRLLSPQQQISKIRGALQTGITHSLVELAELQTNARPTSSLQQQESPLSDNKSAEPGTPPPVITPVDTPLRAKRLASQIKSLKSMTAYLSEVERQAASNAFTEAETILLEHNFEADAEQGSTTTTEVLQNAYLLLKSAL